MHSELVHLKNRIMTAEESDALLQKSQVGRIATVCPEGTPYITPVNYAYEPSTRRIYIHHAAKGGQLLDNLKMNNAVCFEVDDPVEAVNALTGKHICDIDYAYRSVICYGTMSITANEEMLKGLQLLGDKYAATEIARQSNEFEQHKLDRLVVLVIEIASVSGKCREPKPQT
ncbi:MAG: pyridoxamine 5'-phosphate oxidase family protein [Dehalococcoidales bacterium]|nr:pyridoxamine 5'-phosphate oxidase family protein [Dehalococcoidales bacterium]